MSKGRITSKKQATLRITSEWQETGEKPVRILIAPATEYGNGEILDMEREETL
jgi:hypothetical protein